MHTCDPPISEHLRVGGVPGVGSSALAYLHELEAVCGVVASSTRDDALEEAGVLADPALREAVFRATERGVTMVGPATKSVNRWASAPEYSSDWRLSKR